MAVVKYTLIFCQMYAYDFVVNIDYGTKNGELIRKVNKT